MDRENYPPGTYVTIVVDGSAYHGQLVARDEHVCQVVKVGDGESPRWRVSCSCGWAVEGLEGRGTAETAGEVHRQRERRTCVLWTCEHDHQDSIEASACAGREIGRDGKR